MPAAVDAALLDRLVDDEKARSLIKGCQSTLNNIAKAGCPYYKLGGKRLWDPDVLVAWRLRPVSRQREIPRRGRPATSRAA